MPKPNPNKQEIIGYVQREIEQHRAGEIERFTAVKDLCAMFNCSERSLYTYLSNSHIHEDDRDYRNHFIKSEAISGKNHPFYGLKGEAHPRYGKTHSQESIKKMSDSMSGDNNPMYGIRGEDHPLSGIPRSETVKRKISESLSGANNFWYGKTGEAHHRYRKHHSCSARKKLSEINHGKKHTENSKRKMSQSRIGKKHTLETRKKISESRVGEKHPLWNGGTSFLPYSPEFVKVMKEFIRARDDYQCQFCDTLQNGKAHSVHHIDHNKNNDSEHNLLTLCELCHNNETTSSGDFREEWIEYCNEKVQEIYAVMTPERRAELEQLKEDLEKRFDVA
jgi:hypothetical protein